MGRKASGPWYRKGRQWYAWIDGKQEPLGKDKAAAHKLYHLRKADQRPKAPGRHTIAQLVALFLSDVSGEIKPITYKRYDETLYVWSKEMRAIKPGELRAYHLTEWLTAHTRWNASTKYLKGRIVKIWSSWCESSDYIDADRLRKAKLPRPLRREAADPADLELLDRAITCPRFRDLWEVLYDTGARTSEITTLEAAGCSFKTRSALVNGKTGPRVIGLTARAVSILQRLAAIYPDGPLLRTDAGAVWSSDRCCAHFKKWRRLAKCRIKGRGRITAYSLRHALTPRWRAAGIEELVIAKQLGHTLRGAPTLTLMNSTYGHLNAKDVADAAGMVGQSRPAKRG